MVRAILQVIKEGQSKSMDDWFGSDVPLCAFGIKHENRMENGDFANSLFACFSSRKPGGRVLIDGKSRVSIKTIGSDRSCIRT